MMWAEFQDLANAQIIAFLLEHGRKPTFLRMNTYTMEKLFAEVGKDRCYSDLLAPRRNFHAEYYWKGMPIYGRVGLGPKEIVAG